MNNLAADIQAYCARIGLLEPAFSIQRIQPSLGTLADHDIDRDIYPASMIKLPIAFSALRLARKGGSQLQSRYRVLEKHVTTNDAPSPYVAGYEAHLDELLLSMIAFSDNTATNVIIDYFGRSDLTAELHAEGLTQTHVRRFLSGGLPRIADDDATGINAHPVVNCAQLLCKIAEASIPEAAELNAFLAAQHWNGKLSRSLDQNESFAHKTGDTDEYSHDGGIFCSEKLGMFVVVMYTHTPADEDTDQRFGEILRIIRRHAGAR